MTTNQLTVSTPEQDEAGKGGEGGDFQITNAEFVAAVFPQLPEGAFAAVCSKRGDPDTGGWPASRADRLSNGSLPSITTTSIVRVSILAMKVLSRRAKPSLPLAIF